MDSTSFEKINVFLAGFSFWWTAIIGTVLVLGAYVARHEAQKAIQKIDYKSVIDTAVDKAVIKILQMYRTDPFAYTNISLRMVLNGDSSEQTQGFVYLAKGVQHYKIGKTGNPAGRVETLNRQSEVKIEFLHVIPCDNMTLAESYFHTMFRDKRRNGEWFDLADDDVQWFKGVSAINVEQLPLDAKKVGAK